MTDEMHFGNSTNCDEAPDQRGDGHGTYFSDVGAFHAKMGLPVAGSAEPRALSYSEFKYRRDFLIEELMEFMEAYYDRDVAQMGDALVDLVYVALGTAHYMGLPFEELWAEVQRANMAKRRWQEGDAVKPRAAGVPGLDVIKPPGWVGPDVEGVIARFRERLRSRR